MKVRDILKQLEADGWRQVAQKGSHRQFKHPVKPGRVTIPGHPGDDLPPGLEKSIRQQAQLPKQDEGKKVEKKVEQPSKEKKD